MSDDKTRRGSQDSSGINMHEDYEVQYWTNRFLVGQSGTSLTDDKFSNLTGLNV